ncbi:helicase, lymphoid-specific [Haematococcus lacustris]|uniref:Helicase, lymphoid-specific n=1 Tax=Haematococcus lacustris TaxID=44745 RepID=A0A6A0AKB1_HAELA|nr:helicase, lymphoid-specific [Haematococcus lacustris]
MDRVHRIGQTKPVLVFRLATGYSVEGKMLRRAANKMALERLVIKKGAFTQSEDAASTSLSATELLELLQGDYKMDDLPQSGVVSDQDLDQLLDRTHLEKDAATPYPSSGVGYELVQPVSSNSSILQDINS